MTSSRRSDANFHNHIAAILDQFEWFVVGTLTSPETSRTNTDDERTRELQDHTERTFTAMANALAKYAGMNAEELVYFLNSEFEPDKGLHHVHFLIGRHGLEKLTGWQVCEYLKYLADDIEYPLTAAPCQVEVDPVGYVTRKVFELCGEGSPTPLPLEFRFSNGYTKQLRIQPAV